MSKKKGVMIEVVSGMSVTHHIGDGGAAVETWGSPRVKIANVNMPLKDALGKDIGIVRAYSIENGVVKLEAMLKDTPQMRKDLGIDGALGVSMGCAIERHEKAKKKRAPR